MVITKKEHPANAWRCQRQIMQLVPAHKEVLQINPDNALTHGALGVAYYKLGEENLAIHEFQEVLRLDPRNPNARKMLGGLLRQ